MYCHLCTSHRPPGEEADFAGFHGYDAVAGSVDGVVAGGEGAIAAAFGAAGLAHDYLAGFDLLAAEQFNAKALARTIVDIFGGTARFYV